MVSLLSSGWDQVVPTCSGRQAVTLARTCYGLAATLRVTVIERESVVMSPHIYCGETTWVLYGQVARSISTG